MGGTDKAFFFAARSYSLWDVILCITEYPEYSWVARWNVLAAKAEKMRIQLYAADLIWMEVKRHYKELPQPSAIASGKPMQDKRSARQIINDIIKKLKSKGGTNGTI